MFLLLSLFVSAFYQLILPLSFKGGDSCFDHFLFFLLPLFFDLLHFFITKIAVPFP